MLPTSHCTATLFFPDRVAHFFPGIAFLANLFPRTLPAGLLKSDSGVAQAEGRETAGWLNIKRNSVVGALRAASACRALICPGLLSSRCKAISFSVGREKTSRCAASCDDDCFGNLPDQRLHLLAQGRRFPPSYAPGERFNRARTAFRRPWGRNE
jgi:hypothetical protein